MKPIAYTTVCDTVMAVVEEIGLNRKLVDMHSFCRGGAPKTARKCVVHQFFKKHRCWKSENVKAVYVWEDTKTLITVTMK